MPDRRNGLNGLLTTAKNLGPVIGVFVAGLTAILWLQFTVEALAGGAKERQAKIEANQKAINDIKIRTAVQAVRDEALKESLNDIKDVLKTLQEAVVKK